MKSFSAKSMYICKACEVVFYKDWLIEGPLTDYELYCPNAHKVIREDGKLPDTKLYNITEILNQKKLTFKKGKPTP
jgi:hypothetical protein